MKFVPQAIRRRVADQVLLGKKHSPTILLGAGIVSMVGSTVLACRATLQLEEVLDEIENDKSLAHRVKTAVDRGEHESVTYTDEEVRNDIRIILTRGAVQVTKLYAPSVILGGIGVVCLTKSHQILLERNAALTAAYIAVDTAFKEYRKRVVDRYGEETDREFRYGSEDVDIIDEETGKLTSTTRVAPGEPSGYARWFDENNNNWNTPEFMEYNWLFLRTQQNWANDMLRARGHLFLNEAYSMVGLSHTSAGAIVGWVYDRNNKLGDNYVDFGCWAHQHNGTPIEFFNGREGAILLDFNVDGPIWQLIDERNRLRELEARGLDDE
jgi:Family of unknown function (DUF6353)